jgi:16S rRNA (cytidine1402-2'-O)-methyltransferase
LPEVPGTLFVVATPIGNLEDITMRALRVLREASVIAAEDTRRTHHLLARYAIATRTTSLHEHNETRKTLALIERLQQGDDVALVSDAGTPTVSDPGQRLIRSAIEAGIRIVPIPGPSAALAALVGSGLEGSSFKFMGFPPTKTRERREWFNDLKKSNCLVVFYESPHRLQRTLSEMRDILGERQIVVGRELTKVHEEFVRGPISSMIESFSEPLGEFTVIVDIGRTTETTRPVVSDNAAGYEGGDGKAQLVISSQQLGTEFSRLTENDAVSRRMAIRELAVRYGLPARTVYQAVETFLKSVT